MLSARRSVLFIAAFLTALVTLLSTALTIERMLEAERATLLSPSVKSSVGAVIYFLVMSGYGLLYPLGYLIAGKRLGLTARRAVAIAAFAACYVGFSLVFSDSWSRLELVMFAAGVACVFIADICATALSERSTNRE